ncbi:MAG: spore maturation protein [Clostridiales bacterium]|nr:spore maturation protein [Clostridiales bacterium]
MSKVWFFMILASITLLIFKGPEIVISQMLSASADGVALCIDLLGIYCVWLGMLEILDKSGLSEKLARLLSPLIKWLFKSDNLEANKYISINMASNILGLGNAATPSGIKAMQKLDDGSGKASFAAIMLLVINSCSIQILPTTVIGLRESAGSQSSTDIILPTIISCLLTCVFAVTLVFLFSKIKRRKK